MSPAGTVINRRRKGNGQGARWQLGKTVRSKAGDQLVIATGNAACRKRGPPGPG